MADNAETKKWSSLQGVSADDYTKRLKSGEFNEYLKDREFQQAVNSGKLFEKPVPPPTPVEAKPAEPVVKPETVVLEPKVEPKVEPPKPETKDASGDPLWKKKGFATEADFLQSVEDLEKTVTEKQQALDRLNAQRGQEGLRIKTQLDKVEKQNKELAAEIAKYKATAIKTQSIVEIPAIPEMPVSNELMHDEDYAKSTKAYNEALKQYSARMAALIQDVHSKNVELVEENKTIKEKVGVIENQAQFTMQQTLKARENKEMDSIFSEADMLQSKYPELKTSRNFTAINEDVLKMRSGDLTQEDFQKKYNADDLTKYDKISNYIRLYRTFDENGNLVIDIPKRFKSLERIYMADMPEDKLQEKLTQTALEADRKAKKEVLDKMEQLNTNVGLPAGGEKVDTTRKPVEMDEFNELNGMIEMGLANLESNPLKIKRYIELADKYNAKTTSGGIAVPKSWREKFKT